METKTLQYSVILQIKWSLLILSLSKQHLMTLIRSAAIEFYIPVGPFTAYCCISHDCAIKDCGCSASVSKGSTTASATEYFVI